MRSTWIFLITACCARLSWGAADAWQYPLNNWAYVKQGGQVYGAYNANWGNFHLAQDTNVDRTPVGTKVYAPAEGVVMWSTTPVEGYGKACSGAGSAGYVIIIEHTMPDGTKNCSTVGHVQNGPYNVGAETGLVPVGTHVTRGQYIARVADYWTCGWSPQNWHHLHFGIRKGAYAGNPNLAGYGSYAVLLQWWEPNAFVASHPGGGGGCTTNGQYVDIAKADDADGDGRKDIVRFYPDTGRWDVLLSTGAGFVKQTWFACGHGIGSTWQGVGDVNGDGRTDAIVYFESNGRAYVALSTGSSFAGWYEVTSTAMFVGVQNKFLGDVNGDGRTDLIAYVNGNWYVSLSDGVHFVNPQLVMSGHGIGSDKRMVNDLTADGRVDAVVYFGNSGAWYVAYGQPDGTFGSGYAPAANGHGWQSDDQALADIDGNGTADAVAFWQHYTPYQANTIIWSCWAGVFHPDNNLRTCCGQGGGSSQRIYGDFTGDGRADFAYKMPDGWYIAVSDGWSLLPGVKWF